MGGKGAYIFTFAFRKVSQTLCEGVAVGSLSKGRFLLLRQLRLLQQSEAQGEPRQTKCSAGWGFILFAGSAFQDEVHYDLPRFESKVRKSRT